MIGKLDEQQQRYAATMAFFESAESAWQEIQALLKGQDEDRRELEESFNDRRCKPNSDAQTSAKRLPGDDAIAERKTARELMKELK